MAAKNGTDPIDTRLVRRLAHILSDTGLTEIEIERGDLRVRVAREIAAAPVQTLVPAAAAVSTAAAQPVAAPVASAAAEEPVQAAAARGEPVKSPMVGTVYLSPTPGADPFVQPGERVSQGQTLLIIEAMKTMNPIPAPRAGVVVDVLIDNEQPVEFGEVLVTIE